MASEPVNKMFQLYQTLAAVPLGKWAFAKMVCNKAPYFKTIDPEIQELKPGYAKIGLKKRKAVYNHIGTVHAIACCNLCEFAMGVMAEASIPSDLRWLPKGMDVNYLAKADSDLTAVCELPADAWRNGPDVQVPVSVTNQAGVEVVRATIRLWVTEKPAKAA